MDRRAVNRPTPTWILAALVASVTVADSFAAAEPSADSGFRVLSAATRLVDGVHLLDAEIDFAFSREATEALENGVTVTVLVDVEVLRERPGWWDEIVDAMQFEYRVRIHALTRGYIVREPDSGVTRSYRDFEEMVGGLGRISDVPIVSSARLEPEERYRARVRARLDIESLPSPLRPLAYFSALWRLSSEWYSWPIGR